VVIQTPYDGYTVLLSLALCHTYLPTSSLKMAETFSFKKLVSPTHKAMQCHVPKVKNLITPVHLSAKISDFFLLFTFPVLFLSLFSFLSVSLPPPPPPSTYISQFNTVLSAIIRRN